MGIWHDYNETQTRTLQGQLQDSTAQPQATSVIDRLSSLSCSIGHMDTLYLPRLEARSLDDLDFN